MFYKTFSDKRRKARRGIYYLLINNCMIRKELRNNIKWYLKKYLFVRIIYIIYINKI